MSDLLKEYETLKKIEEQKQFLPHLYGLPHYKWSRAFYESRNHVSFLCSGNQCGKSSTLIRKNIHWATEKSLWPELWPTEPKTFWYFYPTLEAATAEFENKWVKEWLPSGPMKEDSKYGWKDIWSKEGDIHSIEFFSGVNLYFKSYATNPKNLQSSSIYLLSADEEMPVGHYDELKARTSAPNVNGYFNMVFTATLGQYLWYKTIERIGKRDEEFKNAFKQQVSWWDCLKYEDGSNGPFTEAYIKEKEKEYPENERKRRIWGRFVVSNEDRKYHAFHRERHLVPPHSIPKSWLIFAGVDVGSGGPGGHKGSHPPAIAFLAVKPDYTKGRIFKVWIPPAHEEFVAGDVYVKYRMLCKELGVQPQYCYYDHQAKDFRTVANRAMDYTVEKAEKGDDVGQDIVNTLFKFNMLKIYEDEDGCAEIAASQLENVKRDTPKRHADDDAADAIRFACTKIQWNFVNLTEGSVKTEVSDEDLSEREKRRRGMRDGYKQEEDRIEDEFNEWNDHYGS